MEAAIRFSHNSPPGSDDQQFLRVDVTGKVFQLCHITKKSRKQVQYHALHSSSKVPAFRAFDWHPVNESLVAVGQSGGEATLLNIAEGNHDSVSFSVRSQRLCNAVALSFQNLIAVGLDKVRTDFCLNIWDLSQRLPAAGSRAFTKSYADPIHKLAGGEPITSLKFFNRESKVLVAGVKGQFVRLYDLREPSATNALQFPTRCVHNLAIDPMDENYFASCYPTTDPLVCLWDRRMVSRNHPTTVGFHGSGQLENKQPEVSLELRNAIDNPGTIWSLRFSKAKRGCLGVLSNMGHLKVYEIHKDLAAEASIGRTYQHRSWSEMDPQDVFLDSVTDIERPYTHPSASRHEKSRIVSFDFTTTSTNYDQPEILVLGAEGGLRTMTLSPLPEPAAFSATGFFCRGSAFAAAPTLDSAHGDVAKIVDQVRRKAESKNALKLAFKQSKQNKSSSANHKPDLRRMSSFANQCWNADLGFFERDVPITDLQKLISVMRLRCMSGYLLNTAKNRSITNDSQWLEAFWSWIDRAERISRNKNMTQDNVDLSFVGVYGVWMEEIAVKPRLVGANSVPISSVIRNLANRLNIAARRFCATEYRTHRQLGLHVSGLAWSYEELEAMTKKLAGSNQHTKAAALALFANEEKLAYQSLRLKTAAQSHKMLAMALAGSKQRRRNRSSASSTTDESDVDDEDDWTETISSLSADLTDPYARAILAYVKSGDWMDVLNIDALPLKHRIGVALRHLDDNKLTEYIGHVTRLVIANGDIEGIILTGTGTTEGLGLLSSYARIFHDLQTAALGLSVGGAAERFINSHDREFKAKRTIEAFQETYRSQIMRWGLKFDRVRFDVASSKALTQSPQHRLPRPKEQVRLVCTFCAGSLTQFPHNGASGTGTEVSSPAPAGMRITDTAKHPLTAEKAAAVGTVCPRCGRHLPRCGVCDLWLGTPDDSFTSWYASQQQRDQEQQQQRPAKNGSPDVGAGRNQAMASSTTDLTASMTGSVMTTIGPSSSVATAVPVRESSEDRAADEALERSMEIHRKWEQAMHKFTVFCVACSHGFHASHAKMWFEGRDGQDGHDVCPVPGCECKCNG